MNESLGNEMYTLQINGKERPVVDAWVGESLLYVLRERLDLPGAKGELHRVNGWRRCLFMLGHGRDCSWRRHRHSRGFD